jgi:hypothetical protein
MTTLNSQEHGLIARRVSIDEWLVAIPCLMNPRDRWNGWACPYFTREAVERIIAAIAPDGSDDLVFATDWEAGTVTLTTAIGTRDEYTDVVEAVEIDGTPYWPVGAWGWVWSDDDEDNCPTARDYAPCEIRGCDHDPKHIAAEREAFADVSDQALWITFLTLDAAGLSSQTAQMDVEREIARRYGPDATEWSAQYFTNAHSTATEMIATVSGRDWAAFDHSARRATAILRDEAILRAMEQAFDAEGITSSWEYPGVFEFLAPSGEMWATGNSGWHYATDSEGYGASIGIADDEEALASKTPQQIAAAWIALIKKG